MASRYCEQCGSAQGENDRFCGNCGASVDGTGRVAPEPPPDNNSQAQEVSLPDVRVDSRNGQLEITYRWYMGGYVAGVVFFLLLLSGYVLLARLDFADSSSRGSAAIPIAVVLGPFALAGFYWCIAGILNATVIRTQALPNGQRLIAVGNGPLPWPGTRMLPVLGLTAIQCEYWRFYLPGRASHESYDILGIYGHGEKRKILRGLPSAIHADVIATQLAKHLGLPVSCLRKQPC